MSAAPTRRDEAAAMDAEDILAAKRAAFALPDGLTYLDGHSLGPAAHASLAAIRDGAERGWADGLIRSWNAEGWIDLPRRVGDRLAALLGARPGEVLVSDNVTVNLFKLALAALPLVAERRVIVEEGEFPTDAYIAQGLARLGVEVSEVPSGTEGRRPGGVLIKSLVNYRSGAVADVASHEAAASAAGGLVLWDLSHAAGVVALDLSAMRLAAGCTYKYLSGGPGAPAYLYVRGDVAERTQTPIQGWFGHAAPFAFERDYRPTEGSARFATGTPPILSLLGLNGALDLFEDVDAASLWEKAGALGDLCIARLDAMGLPVRSPRDRRGRGGHVAFEHEDGYAVVQALIARGVIADFRAPSTVRFGFAPLTLGYAEVWDAMDRLEEVLAKGLHRDPAYRTRAAVT